MISLTEPSNQDLPMRIAMFFSSDPSLAGGIQEHIFYLSRAIRAQGHTLTLFGPKAKSIPFESYVPLGFVEQVNLPNNRVVSIHKLKGELSDIEFDESQFDVCHIHQPYVYNVAWKLLSNISLPKTATFHDGWGSQSSLNVINPFLPLFKDVFSSKVKGAIFVSPLVHHRWKSLCDTTVVQKQIGHGIDHQLFHPIALKTNKLISILFVARLVRRKGLQYLLQALSKLKKNGRKFKLTVVGAGPQQKDVETQVKNLGLASDVIFKGEIKGKSRVKYYQQADIFCAPYTNEGLGLTILEAMSCGCPIVGFWNDAYIETLKNYPGKKLMVDFENVEALAQALDSLISQKKLRQNLRTWLLKKSKQYNWDHVASETIELYKQVIAHQQK